MAAACLRLGSGVYILVSDDVVLAEVCAGLDLDQDDLDLAAVGEAVRRAERDVDGLVLASICSSVYVYELVGSIYYYHKDDYVKALVVEEVESLVAQAVP